MHFHFWFDSYQSFFDSSNKSATPSQAWEVDLVRAIILLATSLWKDRNCFLYGNTIREANELLRSHIVDRVKYLYRHPPRLASRYATIHSVPLESRLKLSTTSLQRWLKPVEHHIYVTKFLRDNPVRHQPTIPQAFARAMRSESALKYPP